MEEPRKEYKISQYVVGFVLSVVFTFLAYFAVTSNIYTPAFTLAVIVALAVMQLIVQLFFFLHLGEELRPRWRLVMFGFAVLVVVILVFGSLWIMDNLNYNMMGSPEAINKYMEKQGGF